MLNNIYMIKPNSGKILGTGVSVENGDDGNDNNDVPRGIKDTIDILLPMLEDKVTHKLYYPIQKLIYQ